MFVSSLHAPIKHTCTFRVWSNNEVIKNCMLKALCGVTPVTAVAGARKTTKQQGVVLYLIYALTLMPVLVKLK